MFDCSGGSFSTQKIRFSLERLVTKFVFNSKHFKGPIFWKILLWKVCFLLETFCEGSINGSSFTSGQNPVYDLKNFSNAVNNFHSWSYNHILLNWSENFENSISSGFFTSNTRTQTIWFCMRNAKHYALTYSYAIFVRQSQNIWEKKKKVVYFKESY